MTALRFRIMGCRPSHCRPVNARGYNISVSISPAYFHSSAAETNPARTELART